MGILDLSADAADLSARDSIKALPRSLGERVEASTAAIFAPDRYFNIAGARQEGWQRAVDELHTVTGQKYLNPYAAVTTEEAMSPDFQPGQIVQQRQNKIIEASRMARAQGNEDLFDPENIDRYIAEESTRRREREASFVDTGNGIGNFIASAAVSMAEPINFITLFGPAARLPSLAAMRTGETFLRNVGREAMLQAGVNTAAQALTEALDYRVRAPLGTEQTAGEVAGNLAGAAVFGAALGGGIRALHLKWLSLSDKTRLDAPVEVRDAFRVIEADALYSGQNRLGVDPLLHERYEGRSFDAILRGRPVDLADLSRTADTPLTALGTILRSEPGTIRADISGLGNTVDRVRALPDTEIEAVLREARPDAFKQIDDIARRAAELDARVSQINSELDQIGLPDVVDLDTAARLQDIEVQLARKGLRRQEREDLEREREMITQSVDPQGRLAEELKALRADFFPEQQKALKEIAEAREALAREREAAQSVVTREIEQMRNRLGGLTAGRQFADEVSPETLAREFPNAVKSADDIYRDMQAGRKPKPIESAGPRDSADFTEWFKGSKVVNDDGSPKIVYHGTVNAFDQFDPRKLGAATDAPSARQGIFFAGDPDVASSYAAGFNPYRDMDGVLGRLIAFTDKITLGYYAKFNDAVITMFGGKAPVRVEGAPNVRPTYVQMKNPKVVDQKGLEYREESYYDIIKAAKDDGHDGVIIKNTFDPGWDGDVGDKITDIYVVFKPEQTRAFSQRFETPRQAIVRDFGAPDAPTLGEAIQRADMMRQVRVFRDVMGEPGSVGFSRSTEAMPSRATETLTPEQAKALDVETARLMENEATASREVSINGRTMSAREAMEDADRMAKDAQAALGCAMGAL